MSGGYDGWFCTQLETECPDCADLISEPTGSLAEFLHLIDLHVEECDEAAEII